MNKLHVLVTGSSGMIGTRLCEALEERGIEWTGLDIRENSWNRTIDARTLHLDIRDIDKCLQSIPDSVNYIVHLAAHSRVFPIIEQPIKGLENCESAFSALELARRKGVQGVVFASSREVYGKGRELPFQEGDNATSACANAYAASKVMGEAFLWAYLRTFGLHFIILRFGNVYGRYDMTDRIVPRLIRQCLRNEEIHVFGKDKVLDFVYIDDAIQGILCALNRFDTSKDATYNISSGVGTSLVQLADTIRAETTSNSLLRLHENRQGEVMNCIVDHALATEVLGYEPATSLQEGIAKSITWYSPYVSKH